jgi:hypothetical protein
MTSDESQGVADAFFLGSSPGPTARKFARSYGPLRDTPSAWISRPMAAIHRRRQLPPRNRPVTVAEPAHRNRGEQQSADLPTSKQFSMDY